MLLKAKAVKNFSKDVKISLDNSLWCDTIVFVDNCVPTLSGRFAFQGREFSRFSRIGLKLWKTGQFQRRSLSNRLPLQFQGCSSSAIRCSCIRQTPEPLAGEYLIELAVPLPAKFPHRCHPVPTVAVHSAALGGPWTRVLLVVQKIERLSKWP